MFNINDLIRKDIAFIDSNCCLSEAARLLSFSDQLILPVVNECFELIGVVTEKDILARLYSKDKDTKVLDYMHREFATIDAKAGLIEIVYIFAEENHKELPVISDCVLKGLIRRSSLIKYMINEKTAVRNR